MLNRDIDDDKGVLKVAHYFIESKIISLKSKALKCKEHGVVNGTAGYLYALLTLHKHLREKFPEDQIKDSLKLLEESITEVKDYIK